MHLLEGIGNVFQEDQSKNDVLVFRRVHVVAELVGGEPELGLEPEVGCLTVGGVLGFGRHGVSDDPWTGKTPAFNNGQA